MTSGNPAGGGRGWLLAAVLGVAGFVSGDAGAAPFRMVTDGPESVWVLDAGSGRLTWCRLVTPSGPKVLDVIGPDVQARPETPRRQRPACSVALRPEGSDDPGLGLGRFGYGFGAGYGVMDGYGYGAVDISDGQVLIVRPKRININLY